MTDVYVEAAAGESLVFKFGDAATPTEAFTAECTINTSRSVTFSSDVTTSQRANCTDPSKPARTTRRVKAQDIQFNGSGTASVASASALLQRWLAGQAFNGKLIQDVTNGWTVTGSWVIDSITMGGSNGEDQTFEISLGIAGEDFAIAFD